MELLRISRLRTKIITVSRFVIKFSWVLAIGALCGFSSNPTPASARWPQAGSSTSPSSTTQTSTPQAGAQKAEPEKKAEPSPKSSAAQRKSDSASHSKHTASRRHSAVSRRRRRPMSPRVRRIHQAFVASATLRPMAPQLIFERSPAAYTGIEAYARKHAGQDAGALAWLVVGYAHILDHDYAKAIDPLNRAKPAAGDLRDYIDYYLGTCYLQTGRQAEALATLANFAQSHPDSLLVRDADVAYANVLLSESRATEVVGLLEKDRLPARSDIELALGRAYAAVGEKAKAAEALSNVYFNMPTSPDADAAYSELEKLPLIPLGTHAQLKTRAELLIKAHRYNEAADTYRELLTEAAPSEHNAITLDLADALHRADRDHEAKNELDHISEHSPELSADQTAEKLYLLGQIAWDAGENDTFYRSVDELRQTAPTSQWLESALLSCANLHLVHHEYDQALDAFREMQQRFPTGSRASYAHWKAAWLTLRQGRTEEAKKLFEEQIALYPEGNETSAALYWRARLAEEDHDQAMARAFYNELCERYRNYYYAEYARERLAKLPAVADPPDYPVLDHIPPLKHGDKIELAEPPADDLHVQKAELLGNGGLVDFAVRELQAAAGSDGGNWALAETAQLYTDTGHYDRAIEVMKHSVPSYFAVDFPTLPREYWEALFPRPYWSDLKKFSVANGLDPYLVASLIRQESEFNPLAVSRANAVGLMQLLPRTGKLVAHQEKLRHYNSTLLFSPTVNLELGTHYFRGMVDHFGGSFEYALAAYDAGADRVQEWLSEGKYRDAQEFVESIPFTETREYVQAILRNASVYRQLYGTP
jgi:soluble lytic murein transglycosylase